MKRALLAAAATWIGCGYVGEPRPPLLNVPAPVADLKARQIGGRIRVEFTIPPLTTEGEVLKNLERIEIKAGPAGTGAFSVDAWAAGAVTLEGARREDGQVVLESPAGPWVGKEILVGANLYASNGRFSGWSNLAPVAVVPPLSAPESVQAAGVKEGVRVSWQGQAPAYRMFRQVAEESEFAPVAEVSGHEWIDNDTSYGTRYRYRVMAVSKTPHGEAVSDLSAPVEIAPQDRYPPDPPGRLTAVASTASIELAWEPSAGAVSYGVDRAAGNGSWERIGSVAAPAYSDHPPESGKTYRYAVTARDASGNESARSEAAEVAAP